MLMYRAMCHTLTLMVIGQPLYVKVANNYVPKDKPASPVRVMLHGRLSSQRARGKKLFAGLGEPDTVIHRLLSMPQCQFS